MPPFLATEHHPISSKDLLSWTFDDLPYDWDEPIYIDALNPSNNISARRARTAIRQLAAGFKAIGLQPGDCVCIHSFNDIWYPIFFLGVIAAGGVYAGTNPAYTAHELAHALKTARVKYVLSQEALLKPVLKAASEVGLDDGKVILFNPGREGPKTTRMQWHDLFQHGEADWPRFDSLSKAKNTTAALLFSSGTTGLPKAAMLSHHNFIAQHTLVYESPPVRPYKAIRLVALPMFHAASAPVAHTTPLRSGEKCYVLPRFELENWFWAHEKYAVTDVAMVPPVTLMAINSPLNQKYSLKAAKAGQVGAAPLDKHPQARMQDLLGGKPLTQVWGMTETSCIATRFRYPSYDATGSVGLPLPGLDLKLVDEGGADVTGFDRRGELCVRGPTVFRGYLSPDGGVDEGCFDKEGYFRTGDVAFVERKSGLWYIVDRKKELIKVRGFQVAPPELEGVLLSHANIVDAAVIGVPDPVREGDELPRAYVVRRSGQDGPSEKEVHAWMRERLASFKMLEGGVRWVEAIPKNASGKILKRVLREEVKGEAKKEKRESTKL